MTTTTTNTCKKCGCEDSFMPSPAPCPTPIGCPTPEPCSEVIDAQCVIYTGVNIECAEDTVVTTNDNVAEALQNIVDYFCEAEPVLVTLTDAGTGTHESLVNDGTGPTLATKGLKAGNAISLSSTGTDITITNTAPNVDQNTYITFNTNIGSTTANSPTDTLNVYGDNGIKVAASSDIVTITAPYAYEIGQYLPSEGGIIVHRWMSSTPYGTPTVSGSTLYKNYIVMDLADLSSTAAWGLNGIDVSNCESTWDGQTNTASLITAGIAVGTAAQLCDVSTNGGKIDWYLPAIDELSMIWQNRFLINLNVGVTSGFNSLVFASYWSSTEITAFDAWNFNFTNGNTFTNNKTNTFYVRAVRRFSIT
jgi:hypothetical protein